MSLAWIKFSLMTNKKQVCVALSTTETEGWKLFCTKSMAKTIPKSVWYLIKLKTNLESNVISD